MPPLNIDTGNTAFMLLCSSLVMLMTPGLAFFYGGLVGRKNVSGHHACGHTKVVLNRRGLA
jgi:ammonia channel protein AmtB